MTSDILGKCMALLCALLWAGAVVLFKRSGETIPAIALNMYKSTVSVFMLFFIMVFSGIFFNPPSVSIRDFLWLAASGVLGITISDTLFFKSLNLLGAGLSAIVDCLYSPSLIVLSILFLAERITIIQSMGAVLVIMAVLMATLRVDHSHAHPGKIMLGILLGAASMIAVAASVIMMKPALDVMGTLWVTEVRMVMGTLALLPVFFFRRDSKSLLRAIWNRQTWRFAFPATVLGNVLAMLVWIQAFTLTDITSAAILNQMSTIFTVILAAIWLAEPFTIRRIAATILGLSGSILVMAGA